MKHQIIYYDYVTHDELQRVWNLPVPEKNTRVNISGYTYQVCEVIFRNSGEIWVGLNPHSKMKGLHPWENDNDEA